MWEKLGKEKQHVEKEKLCEEQTSSSGILFPSQLRPSVHTHYFPAFNHHRTSTAGAHLPRAIFLLFLFLCTLYSNPSSLFLISYNKASIRIQPNGRHR